VVQIAEPSAAGDGLLPTRTASPPTLTSAIAPGVPSMTTWMRLARPIATPCLLVMRRCASALTSPCSTRYQPSGPLALPVAGPSTTPWAGANMRL
jgi:hypothetical protein